MASPVTDSEGEKELVEPDIFSTVDLSKLPEALKKKIDVKKVKSMLSDPKALSFLVTGRSGVGKSTLINSILGMRMEDSEHAHECDSIADLGTLGLTTYSKTKGRIHVTVWDSRGLLDGSSEEVQMRSLDEMVDKCSTVDLKLVCIDMRQSKFVLADYNPDIITMIKLTEAFGVHFWMNVVIVLTFANHVHPRIARGETKKQAFTRKLKEWQTQVHRALHERACIPEDIVKHIKVIPAGHYDQWQLSDRNYWLSDVWFECLDALPTPEAQGAFLTLNIRRFVLASEVKPEDRRKNIEDQPIVIQQDKLPTLAEVLTVLGCGAAGAASGATVGLATLAAGPLGAAIGVPACAMLGLCVGLALGVHKIQEKPEEKKKVD